MFNSSILTLRISAMNLYNVDTKVLLSRIVKDVHRPGIEPGPPAWQASILPLNHRCLRIYLPKILYINSEGKSSIHFVVAS